MCFKFLIFLLLTIPCLSGRNENKPTLDQECQVRLPDLLNQNLCPDESKKYTVLQQFILQSNAVDKCTKYISDINTMYVSFKEETYRSVEKEDRDSTHKRSSWNKRSQNHTQATTNLQEEKI